MSDDFDNPLSNLESISQAYTGEAWSPERALQDFPKFDPQFRAEVMVQFDNALERTDASADLRQYARLTRLREQMNATHQLLRRAGR
jgi:hypothetical protein